MADKGSHERQGMINMNGEDNLSQQYGFRSLLQRCEM